MSQDFKRLGSLLDAARELEPEPSQTAAIGKPTSPEKVNGCPRRRWEASTFATFRVHADNKKAHARALAVANGEQWSACFVGQPGTGKTHLAVATMHAFEEKGGSAYFWKVPDFLEWTRALAYGQSIGVLAVLKDYVTQPFLLVLDDLGVENQTEWAHEQLYRVLDSRYENELPTILTTNQPVDRLDPRLVSRYAEGIVVCKGPDERRRR